MKSTLLFIRLNGTTSYSGGLSMFRYRFFAVTLLFAGAALSQQVSLSPAPVERARRAVELLLQEKYPDVVAMFDARMKAALPADKLAAGLHPALEKLGAVRRRLDPSTQAADGIQVVTLPVEFEQATMNFVVTVTTTGEISGLWMRPAAPVAAPAAQTVVPAAPASSAEARANLAVDLVLQEKYADVIAMFSPQLKTAISEERLRSGLQPILRGSGAVRRRLQPKTQAMGEQQIVVLPVEFEHTTWEFVVSVDKSGSLVGLLARPGTDTSLPWNPPDYSKAGSFRTEDVTFGKNEWQLPGTLAMPAGKGPFPALVLVHGSGPNDRDESIGPQKPFRDLAEGLASRGIAVLRYEKRTRHAAAKIGTIKNFTVQDETVDDALAAAEFLRNRPEFDAARVFVLGHSLGGYLITRIGQRDPKLAGLISLAGSARPLEDIIVEQNIYLASLQGNGPEALKAIEKAKADAQRVKALTPESKGAPGETIFSGPPSYWLDLKGYDPAVEARSLKQPMLILQGERDYQVTMTDFGRWKDALQNRPDVTFRTFPALNHLFETGAGKSTPAEYMSRPSHVSSEVIDVIAAWIAKTK
jgi:uncharacterized protein